MNLQIPRRPSPRSAAAAIALAMLVATSAVEAKDVNSGECTIGGKTVAFIDAVAYHRPYGFDGAQAILLTLTPFVVDKTRIIPATPRDKKSILFQQVVNAPGQKASRLELQVLDGKVVDMIFDGAAMRMVMPAAPGIGELKLDTNDGTRIAGTFRFDGDAKDDLKCSATFDTELAETKAAG